LRSTTSPYKTLILRTAIEIPEKRPALFISDHDKDNRKGLPLQ
jgi:hypothetical protein